MFTYPAPLKSATGRPGLSWRGSMPFHQLLLTIQPFHFYKTTFFYELLPYKPYIKQSNFYRINIKKSNEHGNSKSMLIF